MPGIVVVGTQWGDEGKGKIIDVLTEKADYVVRYQGGANAGHTVIIGDEEYVLHLIPSGILHEGKVCVIGNGVVVDPRALVEEIESLREKGVRIDNNLLISDRAHVIFPYHKTMDRVMDKLRGKGKIGTTGRGIGTAYIDKTSRVGIRMADFVDDETLREKLEINLREKQPFLNNHCGEQMDFGKLYEEYRRYAEILKGYVADTVSILNDALDEGKVVLFEGAQGTMLDIDFGTYPYVTSSNPIAGGVCTGCGIAPTRVDKIVGVVKAYTTRVGEGPFPTELTDETGDYLRNAGPRGEYGATTGRPRRCGWFDAVVVKYASRINNLDYLAVTRLDVLDGLQEVKICVGYEYEGQIFETFPPLLKIVRDCTPVYETLPGWQEDVSSVKSYNDLPANAKKYLDRIAELVGVEIALVSVGPKRGQTITLREIV